MNTPLQTKKNDYIVVLFHLSLWGGMLPTYTIPHNV